MRSTEQVKSALPIDIAENIEGAAEPYRERKPSVLGARKHQVFAKVLLPVATPAIFAALRLGLIYSLLGVVGSELISARDGLAEETLAKIGFPPGRKPGQLGFTFHA